MAGRIKADDVALVKERSSIEDVVREHVTLRSAGPGSMKGLCPFHDEKSPSFNIRPAVGAWHCFGCGEGGDVIAFLQKIDHLTFAEAVERLAGKLGMELHYEDGGGPREEGLGRRSRLIEAHRVAAEFYAAALVNLPEARAGRDFLRARGFDRAAASRFGVGFAPRPGEALTAHLRSKGFSDDEIVTGGLSGRGQRGLYDRFRGRLVWPIRDITGDVVGFGARRLFDDDRIEAKYLNTSETPIYKKASVLYGLDLAKKPISRDRQAVVVEGYTDVMACHLAGIETAVATCGTAFGVEHIKTLRRIMRDESDTAPAKVVFTFDGDAAGQKAAMRAFGEDQRWASQSFVAVEASGQDPCDLRLSGGDAAVRALVEDACRCSSSPCAPRSTGSTSTPPRAGSRPCAPPRRSSPASATAACAPNTPGPWPGGSASRWSRWPPRCIVRAAPPQVARPRPARVDRAPGAPARTTATAAAATGPLDGERGAEHHRPDAMPRPDLRDPVVFAERQLLQAVLQFPSAVDQGLYDSIEPASFSAPAHRAVHDAVAAAGGLQAAPATAVWADKVAEAAAATVRTLVSELAVAPVPARVDPATGMPDARYVNELLIRVREVSLTRRIGDAMSALRRMDSGDPAAARALAVELQTLQRELATLRETLG